MENEIWRDAVGYESVLEVSNLGRIRRKERNGATKNIPAKILRIHDFSTKISISIFGKHQYLCVPELVADAFIPLPAGAVRNKMTAIGINSKFDFSADNLRWVNKALVNPKTGGLYSDMKSQKKKTMVIIKKDENAIVQLRDDGGVVRRYIDINEVMDVHPLWDFDDILMCLTGHFPDAYGWRWEYECVHEKK